MAGKEAVTGKSHSRENAAAGRMGEAGKMAVTGKKERENQMDNSYFDSLAVVLPEDIEKLKWRGEFDRAVRRIDSRLEKDIPQAF